MHRRSTALALLVLPALSACGSKPPPPPPPPAPLVAPVDSMQLLAQARASAEQWFGEGTRLGTQGQWPQAEAQYRRAIAAYPADPRYHFALANALLGELRVSEAADAFQAGIDLEEASPTPNHRLLAEDYERLVQILTRAGRTDQAQTARDRQRYHREMRDAVPR